MPRRYPHRPVVGVGAMLFSPDLQQVVLVRRRNAPAAGSWSFPGGLLETGETARQGCAREVMEETGLQVTLNDLALVAERIIRDNDQRVIYHYIILDFWGITAVAEVRAGSDVRDARWIALDEVQHLETSQGLLEALALGQKLARKPHTSVLGYNVQQQTTPHDQKELGKSMSSEIKHDAAQRRFYTVIDQQTAYIEYQIQAHGALDLQHTFVPEALRGRSLAGKLARFALDYAREQGLKIVPTCAFIKKYLERHPDDADLQV